ncbi:MAG: aminotransferase class V-fold PLP-dependent enzyme [Flavipsychrobacter sp.]|nr:aminotransferase class V-fold PLP-dependent enzyme [Flavipsychrobacter sp.]
MSTNTQTIYLNTAACGLVPAATIAAATELYKALETNSSTRAEHWRFEEETPTREAIAAFLKAPADEVAMIPNFSWAMNAVVQSLKGDEKVLLYKHDYPSLLEPFRINGFDITWVDAPDGFNIDVEAIESAITSRRVDVVAISHVQWTSGYLLDIKRIGDLCKANGVLFLVDATQSMGAQPIDLSVLHIDVFAASNYKWMNAGFGTGVLSIKKEFLQKYPPVVGGNNSYRMIDGSMQYRPSILSYEPGHPNMYGLTVLNAAINHKQELGVANITTSNTGLMQQLLDGIAQLPVLPIGKLTMENRAAFVLLKDENGLGEWLKQHNIIVTQRNGLLRISTHYYNTATDVAIFVDCITKFYNS